MGRPPIGKVAMDAAERQRRHRARLRDLEPLTKLPADHVPAKPAGSITERFRNHLAAANEILESEDYLPEDVTPAETELLRRMRGELGWMFDTFEDLTDAFKWPIKPSEEHRKLAAELKHRADELGCTMKKKGRQYEIGFKGGATQLSTLDDVAGILDTVEGKVAMQNTMECGSPIPGANNAKAVEAYEKRTGKSVARPDNWTMKPEPVKPKPAKAKRRRKAKPNNRPPRKLTPAEIEAERRGAQMQKDWLADHPGKTIADDQYENQDEWQKWYVRRYGERDPLAAEPAAID